jgi:hypothetical protein
MRSHVCEREERKRRERKSLKNSLNSSARGGSFASRHVFFRDGSGGVELFASFLYIKKKRPSLNCASGNHVHRAEYDLPRKVECGPEIAVKDAEGARIAPDGADGAREGHECAHFVARGAGGEEGSDLGRGDVCKRTTG